MSKALASWRGVQGAAAVGVIAVMLVVRGRLLADSYFNQDDFYMSGRAYRSDLTWDYLFSDFAGHVNPFQQLALWLVAHHAPYDWGIVATAILAVDLAATVLVWLILSRLLGAQWSRVVLLAMFAWAPMTLVPTLWWSAAMFLWPHVLCSLVAIWLLVRWRQGDGRGWVNASGIVAVTAVALLWHERAVLIVPLVFGIAVALADEADGWRRLTSTVRRYRWLWLSMLATAAGFLVLHGLLTDVEGGGGTARQQVEVSWSFVGRSVVPGLVGGPWAGTTVGGAVVPATWVTVVSVALVARRQRAAALARRSGAAGGRWRCWLATWPPISRCCWPVGPASGRSSASTRATPPTPSTLRSCASRSASAAPRPGGHLATNRARLLVTGALLASYGVAAAFGTALLVPHFQNQQDRAFVTNLRADLAADPTQVIVDGPAPQELVLPLVGADNRYSVILGPLPGAPRLRPAVGKDAGGRAGRTPRAGRAGRPGGDPPWPRARLRLPGFRRPDGGGDGGSAGRPPAAAGPLLLRDRVDGHGRRRRLACRSSSPAVAPTRCGWCCRTPTAWSPTSRCPGTVAGPCASPRSPPACRRQDEPPVPAARSPTCW